MHAPTACIFAFPAATSRPKNPWRRRSNWIAVGVGRSRAVHSRALPASETRVRWRTLLPERYSRGASPQASAPGHAGRSRAPTSTAGAGASQLGPPRRAGEVQAQLPPGGVADEVERVGEPAPVA